MSEPPPAAFPATQAVVTYCVLDGTVHVETKTVFVPDAVVLPGVHLFAVKMYFPAAGAVQVAMTVLAPTLLYDPAVHTVVTYCMVVGDVHEVKTVLAPPPAAFPYTQAVDT